MRVNIPRALLVVVLVAAAGSWRLATGAQGVTEAERQLQKAILLETVDGNLEAAIDQYRAIVAQDGSNRATTAKALLRLAGCYEKLGNAQARGAYERVIAEFPEQRREVALARARMARLVAASKEDAGGPRFRTINLPNKISWDAQLSPDGKSIAFVDAKDGWLWIAPTSSSLGPDFPGTPRALDTRGVQVDWPGFTWSGDGRFIAFNGAKVEEGRQRIYVVSASGGNPIEVHQNNRDARVVNYRMSLSPNGETLAFASMDEDALHIYKKPVKGGPLERLVDAPAREPVFSPDGKMIAYVEDKDLGRGGGGLWVIPSTGGLPVLVAEAKNASSPIWSSNGEMLAFVDYAAPNQIHVARVKREGKPASQNITIDCPEGVDEVRRLAGWTPGNEIWVVARPPAEFALFRQAVEGGQATFVTQGGYPVQPRWSPDGKRIFHVNSQGSANGDWQKLGIAHVPAEGGAVTRIPLHSEVKITLQGFGTGNRVSPDGKTIVFAGHKSPEPIDTMHIWTLSVEGGTPRQLTNAPAPFRDHHPYWSPDGRHIVFVRSKPPDHWNAVGEGDICIVSADGGEPRRVTSASDRVFTSGTVLWSPDGKSLAFYSRDADSVDGTIKVIPAEGGQPQVVAKVQRIFSVNEMAWSPDGRRIAFNEPGNKIKIVALDDGKTVEIEPDLKDIKEIYNVDWSPDGTTLVFGGVTGADPEIWTISNFLPAAGRR